MSENRSLHKKVNIYTFVPFDKGAAMGDVMRNEVFPLVDTGPTRGGQITAQVLLHHEDGRYQWLVSYETTGGSWHEKRIGPALAKLESRAVVYTMQTTLLLDSQDRDGANHADLPLGAPFSTIRIYQLGPGAHTRPEAFERAMMEEVMPTVSLHPPNRLGHSTDAQVLLKEEATSSSAGDGDRFLWLISRNVYESFKERDSFPGDVEEALGKLEKLGGIRAFDDYRVAFAPGLPER
jgi:hypothetical protein